MRLELIHLDFCKAAVGLTFLALTIKANNLLCGLGPQSFIACKTVANLGLENNAPVRAQHQDRLDRGP